MNYRPIKVRRQKLKRCLGLICLLTVWWPSHASAEQAAQKTVYQHGWRSFPKLTGENLMTGEAVEVNPERGQAVVAFFLASWCVPCQKLTPTLLDLAKNKHSSQYKLYFIFAHDTKSDAQGFAKEYQLHENIILADHDLLAAFKNPPLPSIYLSDRNTWLLSRWLEPTDKDIEQLRRISDMMTVF